MFTLHVGDTVIVKVQGFRFKRIGTVLSLGTTFVKVLPNNAIFDAETFTVSKEHVKVYVQTLTQRKLCNKKSESFRVEVYEIGYSAKLIRSILANSSITFPVAQYQVMRIKDSREKLVFAAPIEQCMLR